MLFIQYVYMFSEPNCCVFVAMSTNSVHLVDYEYAGHDFIVFDIANQFCEYAGTVFPRLERARSISFK